MSQEITPTKFKKPEHLFTAARISGKIQNNRKEIIKLLNQNIDLEYELMLLKAERFETEVTNIGTKKEPNHVPVKFMYWKSEFVDDDGGESVFIDRQQAVEVDGKKSDGFRVIEYYSEADFS